MNSLRIQSKEQVVFALVGRILARSYDTDAIVTEAIRAFVDAEHIRNCIVHGQLIIREVFEGDTSRNTEISRDQISRFGTEMKLVDKNHDN